MDTELNDLEFDLNTEPYIEKISAVGMYWTVRDDKGLLLGNSCEELHFALPDFIVIRSFAAVSDERTIKVLCTTPNESNLGSIKMEIELELAKGVPPDYAEANGNIVIKDVYDKQLVDTLRHSSGAGRCGLCGIKVPKGKLINYCCPVCYANVRKSVDAGDFGSAKALSSTGLAFIRKLQGDNVGLCHICNEQPAAANAEVCSSCALFISSGCKVQ